MIILRLENKNIAFYDMEDLISIGYDKNTNYPISYYYNEMETKLKEKEGKKKIHYRAFIADKNSPTYFYDAFFKVILMARDKDPNSFYTRRYDKCRSSTAIKIARFYSQYHYEKNYYDGSDTEIDD